METQLDNLAAYYSPKNNAVFYSRTTDGINFLSHQTFHGPTVSSRLYPHGDYSTKYDIADFITNRENFRFQTNETWEDHKWNFDRSVSEYVHRNADISPFISDNGLRSGISVKIGDQFSGVFQLNENENLNQFFDDGKPNGDCYQKILRTACEDFDNDIVTEGSLLYKTCLANSALEGRITGMYVKAVPISREVMTRDLEGLPFPLSNDALLVAGQAKEYFDIIGVPEYKIQSHIDRAVDSIIEESSDRLYELSVIDFEQPENDRLGLISVHHLPLTTENLPEDCVYVGNLSNMLKDLQSQYYDYPLEAVLASDSLKDIVLSAVAEDFQIGG